MTRGSLRGHILRMTLMMLAAMFLQMAYSLVDIYWVAQLGKQAVAAVSIAAQLNMVTIALSQVIGVGTVALVAQAAGRKDEVAVQRSFNQAQSLSLLTGAVFFVAMSLLARPYAELLASDAATSELILDFLAWFVPALALQFSMIGLGSALRGVGNMKPGLFAQGGSVLLNMLIAPFLIFGWWGAPKLGVQGAAVATFISTIAAVSGLAWYLGRDATYFRVDARQWKPDWALWRRLLGIGLPAGAEFGLMTTMMLVIFGIIGSFGAEAQAGFGIGMRIMQAAFMPAICLSFAVAAVVGQNYGGREFERVKQTFIEGAKLNVIFMLLFTALCHIAPEGLIALFTPEAGVVAVGGLYLKILSYNYVAFGLIVVSGGVFQGLGNTWPPLLASAIRVVSFIVVALWMSHQPDFSLPKLWYWSVATVFMQMVISLWLLRREFGLKLAQTPEIAALQPSGQKPL